MDFSKLEPVLFAWNANDEKMLDFFLNGGGYLAVAKELLHKKIKEGSPEYKGIKAICLGIQYNMKLHKTALWEDVQGQVTRFQKRFLPRAGGAFGRARRR